MDDERRAGGRPAETDEETGLPAPAQDLLDEWLTERAGLLLHAWVAEDDRSVFAVVATAPDEAFDAEADEFDVDAVELRMLTVYDTLQEGWELVEDQSFELRELFGALVAERFGEEGEE